jgi:hypothetical protein
LDGALLCLNTFADPQCKNFERREIYGFVQSLTIALGSVITVDQIDEISKQLDAGYRTMFAQATRIKSKKCR